MKQLTWRDDRPKGRVWALILWCDGVAPIPEVAQFSPADGLWYSQAGGWYHWSACEWCPLPAHERFNPKTHAILEEQDG